MGDLAARRRSPASIVLMGLAPSVTILFGPIRVFKVVKATVAMRFVSLISTAITSGSERFSALLAVMAVLIVATMPVSVQAQEAAQLQVTSAHYIVVNADTGSVFAQRGAHDQVAIASLTKMFTAIEALELAPLDTMITTDESDLKSADATTMGFGPGETYTLKDLLYGMLLPSGNDAAHAIARSLGGQPGDSPDQAVQRFMDLVNQRIADLGLKNTHLVNPDGWGVPGHYSSAWDVATFMSYAMNYPTFIDIIGTSSYTTSNGYLTVSQSNKMINTYAALVGGKTGYDDDAGWCLANLAKEGSTQMIAVTLDGVAPDDWYDDNTVLLDFGFAQQAASGASSQGFTGETIGYVDPSASDIARSVSPGSSLALAAGSDSQDHPATAVAAMDNVPPRGDTKSANLDPNDASDSSRPVWIVGTVLALVAASSLVTYRLRWGRGNRAPHVSSVDTPSLDH